MSGEKDLTKLLQSMSPEKRDGQFVFCTIEKDTLKDEPVIMRFRESEGDTLILMKSDADRLKLKYETVWAMITLNIHSSLEAVGFLAKITESLAAAKISVNAVSAYYHDHLFVPKEKAELTVQVLDQMIKK